MSRQSSNSSVPMDGPSWPMQPNFSDANPYDEFAHKETAKEKFIRKFLKEPLVPIGCLATAAVLGGGMRNMVKAGSPGTSQKFMRARVVLQGATVMAFAAGAAFSSLYDQFGLNEEQNSR